MYFNFECANKWQGLIVSKVLFLWFKGTSQNRTEYFHVIKASVKGKLEPRFHVCNYGKYCISDCGHGGQDQFLRGSQN